MTGAISHDALAGIGTLIDEAALDLRRWQAVVDEFARLVPGTRVLFQVVDPVLARAAAMVASGWDASILSDYARHYGAINPWVPALMRAPAMQTIVSDHVLAPALLRKTEFYQDLLRPIGEADASMGMKLLDNGARLGAITVSHDARHADRVNLDGARILEALAPRIRRSLDVGRMVAERAWHDQAGSLVGALADAALIVTREGRLLEANTAAEMLISGSSALRIGAGDRVIFSDAQFASEFARGVRRATTHGLTLTAPTELRLRMREGGVTLSILGLRPDMLKTRGLAALLVTAEIALIVIRPLTSAAQDRTELLSRHGLTKAETRLALAMDGSRSLRSVADDFGIAHETARSQLKAVFAKLGVSRQSELVALLSRIMRTS